MKKHNDKQLIVGLDIGTSKVMAIVGEHTADGAVEVIGLGSHVSRGMKRGVVVDIESNVYSIRRAVEEAEVIAGCDIRSVTASISGSHLETRNSHGTAPIRDREVTQADLEQALNAAGAVAIPADREVLYKDAQEYRIDGHDGIRSPVGMSGVRLEVSVHLVTGALASVQNIRKCIQRCGLAVDNLVPSALASARAVLTDDERELGVCLVDIGAGTTDVAIYAQGAIRYTKTLPIGGDQVTGDIAYGVQTPTAQAEDIKIKYACAMAQFAQAEETIMVPSVGDRAPRRLAVQSLAQTVQARYEEIFEMVHEEIRRSGFDSLIVAGIVLTGGAARIEGALELAEEIFQKMVRIGVPQHVSGLTELGVTPLHATSVGLLLHGARDFRQRPMRMATGLGFGGRLERLRYWFANNF